MGLSYGKIQRKLAAYFGLTVSLGELPTMVAEVARLFDTAYAHLITLMHQQAAIHIDETGWCIDGTNHWLWVFVNGVVALYVVTRSRGSKAPKALLEPDFDGVGHQRFLQCLQSPRGQKRPSAGPICCVTRTTWPQASLPIPIAWLVPGDGARSRGPERRPRRPAACG